MVISSDKVKIAREKLSKFFSNNRKDTTLKVTWSRMTDLDVEDAFSDIDAEEELIKAVHEELEKEKIKNHELFKDFEMTHIEDTYIYSYPIHTDKTNNDEQEN